MRDEMVSVLTAAGRDLSASMAAAAPALQVPHRGRAAGALRAAFGFKVYPKFLKLRVGLLGKRLNQDFFYARIIEFGRGLKKTLDTRGRRIGVIQPMHIVFGPRTDLRRAVGARLRGIWGRALDKAASGAGNSDA